MKFQYLREFLVLAECLNFTAAAEQLYITQPGLSRHLAMLEDALGTPLLYRDRQNICLTDAGLYFQKKVKNILRQYDEACHDVQLKQFNVENVLRIGLPIFSTNDYLGPIPKFFEQEYPDIKLSYFFNLPDRLINLLFQDKVDTILITDLPFLNANKLRFHHAYEESYIALLPQNITLTHTDGIPLFELTKHNYLNVDTHYFSLIYSHFKNICKSEGLVLKQPILYKDLNSVLVSIRNGLGFMIFGHHTKNLALNGIVAARIVEPECSRKLTFAYKPEKMSNSLHFLFSAFDKFIADGLRFV